jgi:ureidoglycolate hydrolase
MSIDSSLLQVLAHGEPGFLPLVDYANWRVAVLNACAELRPENLTRVQRHDETDEVFVLLQGQCVLVVGDGQESAGRLQAANMVPRTIYNVRRGVWHTHALGPDAMVLVIENRDTTFDNSPFCALTTAQTAEIVARVQDLWSGAEG